jgi:hypothetical protein
MHVMGHLINNGLTVGFHFFIRAFIFVYPGVSASAVSIANFFSVVLWTVTPHAEARPTRSFRIDSPRSAPFATIGDLARALLATRIPGVHGQCAELMDRSMCEMRNHHYPSPLSPFRSIHQFSALSMIVICSPSFFCCLIECIYDHTYTQARRPQCMDGERR